MRIRQQPGIPRNATHVLLEAAYQEWITRLFTSFPVNLARDVSDMIAYWNAQSRGLPQRVCYRNFRIRGCHSRISVRLKPISTICSIVGLRTIMLLPPIFRSSRHLLTSFRSTCFDQSYMPPRSVRNYICDLSI